MKYSSFALALLFAVNSAFAGDDLGPITAETFRTLQIEKIEVSPRLVAPASSVLAKKGYRDVFGKISLTLQVLTPKFNGPELASDIVLMQIDGTDFLVGTRKKPYGGFDLTYRQVTITLQDEIYLGFRPNFSSPMKMERSYANLKFNEVKVPSEITLPTE